MDAEVVDTGRPAVDGATPAAEWAVNIVVAGGPEAIRSFIEGGPDDGLLPITNAFFDAHEDDFDFLYLLAEVEGGAGRYMTAHRPAMPENGLTSAASDARYGSAGRLKGVVALRLGDSGNGPTLHETGHYWMNFLDRSFGFGQDLDRDWGPHWGASSVNGQLGGFDGDTLRCTSPADSPPPCTPEPSGRIGYTTAPFGPAANGGDVVPYAPLELYLMGLAPAAEVTPPLQVLIRPMFVEELPSGRLSFEADGMREVPLSEIIAIHGEKTPLPEDERIFRGAFVLVTETPATEAQLARVRTWSRVFAGEENSGGLLSFTDATSGRAHMDTAIR